jgi:iron uptake system EfeUOB component EfeO/EfeM
MDRYFSKNMDPAACKRILEGIKELQSETDWFVINKDVVNATASADVAKALDVILLEYEAFVKARVENLIQQTETE